MSQPRLPNFLIIGAAKAGTTTLFAYLAKHPDVFMCEPKEPEFFSRKDKWSNGLDWYRSLFANARPDQALGEASTTYTRWPHTDDAAGRIAETLPDTKLVYILRHPVERTYSHYGHHVSRFGMTRSFEQALAADSIYVDCSRYLMQIERYLERGVARERILVLTLDDLQKNPTAVLQMLQEHIGVEVRDLVAGQPTRANARDGRHFIRERIRSAIGKVPGVLVVAEAIPSHWKQKGYNLFERTPFGKKAKAITTPPPMLLETRQRLLELFREENNRLAAFLDRDLSTWND